MANKSRGTSPQITSQMFRFLRSGFVGVLASAIGVTLTFMIWIGIIPWPSYVAVLLTCMTIWAIVIAEYSLRRSEKLMKETLVRTDQSTIMLLKQMARATDSGSTYDYLYLIARLKEEQARVDHHGGVMSLLAVQLDAGTDEGEEPAVRELVDGLAQDLNGQLRAFDELRCVTRNEFLVILPRTNRQDARAIAGDLCDQIAEHTRVVQANAAAPRFSVNVGLATYPLNGATAEHAFEAAREAVAGAGSSAGQQIFVAEHYVGGDVG